MTTASIYTKNLRFNVVWTELKYELTDFIIKLQITTLSIIVCVTSITIFLFLFNTSLIHTHTHTHSHIHTHYTHIHTFALSSDHTCLVSDRWKFCWGFIFPFDFVFLIWKIFKEVSFKADNNCLINKLGLKSVSV